jgi:hypothetical protein
MVQNLYYTIIQRALLVVMVHMYLEDMFAA